MRNRIEHFASLHHAPRRIRPPFDMAEPERPIEPRSWQADQTAALLEALDGVELGDYDRRIIEWLAGWDTSVIGTVASRFYRARATGRADGVQ